METQNTPTENAMCCKYDTCCKRRHCCKMIFGVVNTLLMATIAAAVTCMCAHKCHHKG
ncbi:MAG: hypothetical protein IJB64_04410 [Akkermansia sp.]|nr:hypothetical protein [Akkermansia sp.]MBQ4635659.1 hypothetical protein [Akkermansia sp.]MBQ9096421.1 hypothetical protein [Akkermansia sp.]